MRIATYTNARGDSLSFRPGSPFVISDILGLGDVDATVQLQQAPYQDGGSFIESILSPRAISFRVWMDGKDDSEISRKRSQLSALFNPKLGPGRFEYRYGEEVRQIEAVAEHVPTFPTGFDNRGKRHQIAVVDLLCPDPYWRTATENVEQLVTFSGGLTFPLRLPTIFGNQDSKAKSRIIVNNGDSPAPIEITFEGPATTPIRIDNETTGEFIEVNQSLLEGEQLWINTAFGRKRVEKILADGTRINAFHHILVDPTGAGPSSTFFQLQPGNNLMTYNTGVEYEKAPVTIRFQPRYLAI